MIGPQTAPPLDERDAPAFAAALRALAAGYVPQWRPGQQGADAAMLQIVAHQLQAIARRLNQAPDKNKLAFLDLAGVSLVTAQPARAPVVFGLADNATDLRLPDGTRLAAPPPPGGTSQISYETETPVGLAVAKLREVVSLWPGRDQYIDHSAAATAGQPFQLFRKAGLVNTPHVLYLAHNRLLALAGASAVTASFELTTPSSEYLDIRWEYWDGAVWRPFADMRPACSNAGAAQLDSTNGLRSSGAYQLRADCATTAPATVDGVPANWVRARLEETQPPDPARVLPEVDSIRLSTTISRSYATIWQVAAAPDPQAQLNRVGSGIQPVNTLSVQVLDATGVPLEGVDVASWAAGETESTDERGRVDALPIAAGEPNTIDVTLDTFDQTYELTPDPDTPLELTFTLDMLSFDQAVSGGATVNLSQPFPPLGLQPQPGAALYFSHAEAFGKPGAQLRIYVQPGGDRRPGARDRRAAAARGQLGVLERAGVGVAAHLPPEGRSQARRLRRARFHRADGTGGPQPDDGRRHRGAVDARPAGQRRVRLPQDGADRRRHGAGLRARHRLGRPHRTGRCRRRTGWCSRGTGRCCR